MTPLRLTFPIPPFLQVTWLAKWKDSINGEDKCVWLAANSSWKGKSDLAKYEKARKLKDHIGKVREDYMAGMRSKKEAQQQKAEAEAYWSSVQDTISTGNLKGLSIPQRTRGKFYDWMTNPINEQGATQRDLDRQNIDQETALAVEYLLYQGFDLRKLATSAAATQKVSNLKSKLSSAPSAGSRLKSRTKSGTTKANSIPSLKDLL